MISSTTAPISVSAMGQYARVMPMINIQGTADEVVVLPAGLSATEQWLNTDDLIDDGADLGECDGPVRARDADDQHPGHCGRGRGAARGLERNRAMAQHR